MTKSSYTASRRKNLLRQLCISWLREFEPEILLQLEERVLQRIPVKRVYKVKPGKPPKPWVND